MLKLPACDADLPDMSDDPNQDFRGEIRDAKKAITSTGMRTGRMGMVAVMAAVGAFVAGRRVDGGLRTLATASGLAVLVIGLLALAAGWQLSKAGGVMISALSDPSQLKSAFLGERQSMGGRRVVSVLLVDGRTQSVALPEERTNALYQLLARVAPKAELGVHAAPQRAILRLPEVKR